MKEINKKTKEEIVISKQAEINKGIRLIGSQRIQKGQKMWQFNVLTGELTEAEMTSKEVYLQERINFMGLKLPAEIVRKREVITVEGCQYFPALNRKNAIKKLNKIGLWVKN